MRGPIRFPEGFMRAADHLDQASALTEMDTLLAAHAAARALAGEGGDGRCAGCGEPIPPARLAALPNAVRCLPCQRRHEGGRGLGGFATRCCYVGLEEESR